MIRSGKKNIRRRKFMEMKIVGRCVEGEGIDGNIKKNLIKRKSEIEVNIERKRIKRRDIESVKENF